MLGTIGSLVSLKDAGIAFLRFGFVLYGSNIEDWSICLAEMKLFKSVFAERGSFMY